MSIRILDCTLRDGAYIVKGKFGEKSIRGIINYLSDSRIDIIECGWLKNDKHELSSTYFHVPSDLSKYVEKKDKNITYAAMIDWDRYDINNLPNNDGTGVDLIRVAFPKGKVKESVEIGKKIVEKGYKLYFQAANTLAYTEDDIKELCEYINISKAECLYMVDTFGAMFDDDVDRIANLIDKYLDKNISIGFHSHNNMQLAFSNSIKFIKTLISKNRDILVDSSLMGMGRGAGNATTELMSNYLNKKYDKHYNFDAIMDTIDTYIKYYDENYKWGYSTPFFIAGMYCCHVNNIAYLLDNHGINSKDMRNVVESLDKSDRVKYDYDLLESKYIENQNIAIDDSDDILELKKLLVDKKILLVAPGKSVIDEENKIFSYIEKEKPIVIGVNAIIENYVNKYSLLYFVNKKRYDYAKNFHKESFMNINKIILSNIKQNKDANELIVSYAHSIKKGYLHFDNAVISCLRLLDYIGVKNVTIAGFDGFKTKYNESYADAKLPTLNIDYSWDDLNNEIIDMMKDFRHRAKNLNNISFLTESIFNV